MSVGRLHRWTRETSAAAAIELGLVAPFLFLLIVMTIDFGRAFLQQNELVSALSAGVQYGVLAVQHGTALATIETNTPSIVAGASNSLLTSSNVTATLNNGNPSTDTCCISGGSGGTAITWTCAASPPTCSDGSNPGVYMKIYASVSFQPLFSLDKALTGESLAGTVIERIQ